MHDAILVSKKDSEMSESVKNESIFILIALIVLIFAFYFFREAQMIRTPRNISIVENNFHFGLSRDGFEKIKILCC